MIYYTEQILIKFPKSERFSLVNQIKNTTFDGLRTIIFAYKEYEKKNKLQCLNNLDANIKLLKVFVRISYKNKYINSSNRKAWIRKLTNINNLMLGWISKCVRQ